MPLYRLSSKFTLVPVIVLTSAFLAYFTHYGSFSVAFLPISHHQNSTFVTFPLSGFANHRIPHGANCDDIRVTGEIEVSQSIYLTADLLDVANLIEHPMIDYSGQAKTQSFASMVQKTWARMSGSSVWLERYGLYMTVSRVFFYDKGVKHWPIISFLHAQLHDENWKELRDHELYWHGERFTFPRILDIDAPYKSGGGYYGPEDPRIIIEQGVPDAEPVVIFNMIANLTSTARSMHAHHPFSNFTTEFIVDHKQPEGAEKNWMPFFVPSVDAGRAEYPSSYIHFLYEWHPLRILQCHLRNGGCRFVYWQPLPESYEQAHKHNDTASVMRGGSNFAPIPETFHNRGGLVSYVGMPRTHVDAGCMNEAVYRPEIVVLTTDRKTFWLDYASEAADFGTTILPPSLADDACDTGRIMMANSIARVYNERRGKSHDVMEVTFSVADETVQTAKVRGVLGIVGSLPQFQVDVVNPIWQPSDTTWNVNVTSDVLLCSIESAERYALERTPASVGEGTGSSPNLETNTELDIDLESR